MRGTSSASTTLANALERESAWLHRLARALTRDEAAASDAAQRTLLRAWQRGSDEPPRRAWLARVLTNALRDDARRAGLRRDKEAFVARTEQVDSDASGLERVEIQRRVVDAVDALSEPYRTTLVLRFFDGLSPRAIAARESVPAKTVYTRIERGLERLRSQLDARCGNDRAVWVGALLALPPSGAGWTFGNGTMAMSAGAKVGAGVIVLAVAVGAIAWSRSNDPHAGEVAAPVETRTTVEPALVELATDDEARQAVADEPEVESIVAPVESELGSGLTAVSTESVSLQGRVLDVDGLPLSGVHVRTESEASPVEVTDGEGRFELEWERAKLPVKLVLEDRRYAALREALVSRGSESREHLLVVAPALDLHGTVVDDGGRALAGVAVTLRHDDERMLDFPYVLDTTSRVHASVDTTDDGRFELRAVPVLPGCELVARKRGYEQAVVELVAPYKQESRIELSPAPGVDDEPRATGVVLLPDRTPAEGALVRYGSNSTEADAYGRFELALAYAPEPDQALAAGLAGYGTAIVERFGELQEQAAPHAPPAMTLVLHEDASSLSGQVVDANGVGLEGWEVRLEVGTWLSRHQVPPILAESLTGIDPVDTTTGDGSFELQGLLDRDYRVMVYDPQTLLSFRAGPYAAGSENLRIEVPGDMTYPRVIGRVVSRRNEPVPNARVATGLYLHAKDGLRYWVSGGMVETDESGRFELADVPRSDVHLNIGGESIIPMSFDLGSDQDIEDLVVEVALRCHFRVEVIGDDLSDLSVEAETADGERVMISSFSATGSSSGGSKRLTAGKMEPAAVTEDALYIVLYRRTEGGKEELARRSLTLVSGEICEVLIELE